MATSNMYNKFGCGKQLHFDSKFSVLLYTILLCIINYTFTARGVMSRRQ